MKNVMKHPLYAAAVIGIALGPAGAYGQAPRAGPPKAGTPAANQKAAECKRAAVDAVVNCGTAVVGGAAASATTPPPANVIVGVGIPAVVCTNEATKVAAACGSNPSK